MLIAIVFDVSEKMDDFLKSKPSFKEILIDYYLNFIIHYGNLFTSLILFIALIWCTSKMAQRTEVVAIISSGVSFKRFMLPFFVATSMLVIISLFAMHFLVPYANKVKEKFELNYISGPFEINDKNHHVEIKEGTIAYFKTIKYQDNWGSKFSIEEWNENNTALKSKLIANYARFDSINNKWSLENYDIRTFTEEGEELKYGTKIDTVLDLKMSDFGVHKNFIYTMTTPELIDFIENERLKGSDKIPFYEIEKHQRSSYPAASYILTLIGVSVASRKVRGGMGLKLVYGILIAVLYIFAMKIMTVATTNMGLNSLISVWTPNFIFSIIAVILYIKTPK